MSSEEKEGYFDGPLVTTPNAQGLFYPGGNPPPPFVPLASTRILAVPPPQPPSFFNPGVGVNANPWNAPVQQHFQPQYNADPEGNMVLAGAQAYFGGENQNQQSYSAPVSQQHSPEKSAFPKTTDVQVFNPSNFESHTDPPGASTLYSPHLDGSTSTDASPASFNHQFSPEHNKMPPTMPPSGGASGQKSFVPTPPSFFVPTPTTSSVGAESYMNPVVHNDSQQHQSHFYVPDQHPDLTHVDLQRQMENDSTPQLQEKDAAASQFDLHNGNSNQSLPEGNQSYMNIAFNHDYQVNAPGQDAGANTHLSDDFQVGARPPMMIPVATSGQDYDILHSQGTWRDQHPSMHDQVAEANNTVTDLESTQLQGDAVHSLVQDGSNLENNESGDSFLIQEVQGPLEPAAVSNHLIQDDAQADNVTGGSEVNKSDSAIGGYDPNVASDYLKHDEEFNQVHTDSATLTLDYQGSLENAERVDATKTFVETNYEDKSHDHQQSYEKSEHIQNQTVADENLVHEQPSSIDLQADGYAVGGSALPPSQKNETLSSESPIPADGLHHKQPVPDEQILGGSHHFASANSAFESRIRSQSTGSNISNNSSQMSASGLAGRSSHNRNFSQSGASATALNAATKAETAPTAGPFSTDTMHSSSHNPISMPSTPMSSAPLTRAAIPDIVRPLPSNSSGENLRTGATMVPYSTNQSLHSQVLRNITAYPPEPTISSAANSVTVSSPSRQQPDLVQSPLGAGAIPKSLTSEVTNAVAGLKISGSSSRNSSLLLSADPETSAASHDPYLSHTLHNSSSSLLTSIEESRSNPPARDTDASTASVPPHPNAKTNDQHERDIRDEPNLESSRTQSEGSRRRNSFGRDRSHDDDDDIKKDYRDMRRSDERRAKDDQSGRDSDRRRRDDDYTKRDDDRYRRDDDRYRRDDDRRSNRDDESRRRDDELRNRDDDRYNRRLDHDDDRYRDDRYSRHDHHSRPSSRQSGYAHDDPYHSRRYDDRYYDRRDDRYYDRDYRDYRDPYWSERYRGSGYDHRDYYEYDRRSQQYYDYRSRYPEYYRDYHGYDRYDRYPYPDSRHPDEDDSRSIQSETSRLTEHEQTTSDRDWGRGRHPYEYYPDPRHHDYHYGEGYYDQSIVDGSTLSHTLDESYQYLPPVPARQTPMKFSSVHTIVRFGAGGQLIKVLPNRPSDNQPSTVEIHSIELLLQHTEEAEDLRSYPGPLSKEETHKNDVLQFTSNQAADSSKNSNLMDRQSTALIWEFLAILVRQNGSVLGTDIAELLTKDHSGDFGLLQSPLETIRQQQRQHGGATPNSIPDEPHDSSSPVIEQVDTKSVVSNVSADVTAALKKNCFRFRDLLLHGRKKDALEWAMKSGLWGHALLLASKTDSRTHAQVMLRFANSLPINDPLQTVYQLMSGRQPAAATCVSEEGWGDWRPHLAMILSNPTPNPSLDMRAVLTMGDTLSARGLLHAAHFCYLMSSTPLGYYGRPNNKMVLLGGNHMLSFREFAMWESIRRTEIYEYAISLSKQQKSSSASISLPSFQLYKFIYSCKLAEYGLIAQAFHYCELIAKSICKSPTHYSETLVNQLVNLSDQLRYHDPQIQAGVSQAGGLRWLETLKNVLLRMQAGSIVPRVTASSSLMTTSNSPSVISSSPSADEIQFQAPSADLENDAADGNADYISSQPSGSQYDPSPGHHYDPYSNNQVDGAAKPPMFNPDLNVHQAPPLHPQAHSQEPSAVPFYDPSGMPKYSGGPVDTYTNQNVPFMQPPQTTSLQNFSHLAHQANPLSSAYPSAGAHDTRPTQYQTQGSYGFEAQANAVGQEQQDQVDYYQQFDSSRAHHQVDSRVRTISQSSQRSRGSTVKGIGRTTPTVAHTYGEMMQGRRSRTTSENSAGKRSRKVSGEQQTSSKQKGKENIEKAEGVKKSGSWLFGWWSKRMSKQIHLPDDSDKEIVYDHEKKRWVNKNATEEDYAPPPPPPTDRALAPASAPAVPAPSSAQGVNNGPPSGSPQLTANRFSLKNIQNGSRAMYKNAFSASSKPVSAPAPVDLPGMSNPTISGFMIPNPVPTSQPLQPADIEDVSQGNPTTPPVAAQSIASTNVPPMAPMPGPAMTTQDVSTSSGPTMFFNPSQLAAQPDLLAQPSMPPAGRGNAARRRGRGRPMYPGRT